MEHDLAKIKNEELQEVLKYVGDEARFLGDNMRLLSKDEIENYKEILKVEVDGIVPLIDLSDNDFLVYDIAKGKFEKMNITDGTVFDEMETIEEYLKTVRNS